MNTPETNNVTAQIGWDFTHSGVGANFPAVKISAAKSRNLHLVNTSNLTGGAMFIDVTAATASRVFGLKIEVDNTGTNGLVCGIDLSSFAADEPLFKVPVDTDVTSGTLSARYAVRMNTTTYYVKLYAES